MGKPFFKPTVQKIIISLMLFSFLPVIAVLVPCMCGIGPCGCPSTEYFSLIAVIYSGYEIQISIVPILGLTLAYLISSITIYLWDKIPLKKKNSLKEKLKLSKAKIIITVIGWITLGSLTLHYLTGFYGGVSNFPPLLNDALELVNIVLTPVSIITYLLSRAALLFILLLNGILLRIPVSFGGFVPEEVTLPSVIIIVPLLAIDWYLLSCLVVYIFESIFKGIRNKKRSK